MRSHRMLAVLLVAGTLLACNFPLFAPEAYQPTEEPTITAFATITPLIVPTQAFTPLPTASPNPTVAATPTVPVVTPNSVNVNCRSGPDVAYDSVSVLVFGSTTQVVGRSTDSSWWYVQNPSNPSGSCWIFSGVVTIAGPTGGIPVQAPPAAIVTKLTAGVTLPATVTCGGPNPVSFKGTITTNGPATVKYQWEVTGDKTNTTSPEMMTFGDAGTQNVPDPGAYSVDCGQYTITLHVLTPNDTTAGKDFKVAAP